MTQFKNAIKSSWDFINSNKLIILVYGILITFVSIVARVYLDWKFFGIIASISGVITLILLLVIFVYAWIINPITSFIDNKKNE